MSRLLSDLEPVTYEKVIRLLAAAPLVLGRELFIVYTHRTYAEQDALYAKGREKEGSIVTNAKGGDSWHNVTLADGTPWSHAIDFAFEEHGTQRPTWSTATRSEREEWELLGKMGKSIGLEWGGDFKDLGDYGHFHNADGGNLDRAKAKAERTKANGEGN